MPTQISYDFQTDVVNKRTHNRIIREANRKVGEFISNKVLPRKFSRHAYLDYPGVVRRRSRDYQRRKRAKVGHDIPNVLTGAMRGYVLTDNVGNKITATRNGGRVYIRNYFPMPARQRLELEAINDRDRSNMATTAAKHWFHEIGLKKNQRKRRVKGSRK